MSLAHHHRLFPEAAGGIAQHYAGTHKESSSCVRNDPCPLGTTLYERPNPVARRMHFDVDYSTSTDAFEIRLPTSVKLRALSVEELLFTVDDIPSGNFLWLQVNAGEVGWNGDWYGSVPVSADAAPASQREAQVSLDRVPITAASGAVQLYEPRRPMIREWTGSGRPHTQFLRIRLVDRFGAAYQVGADSGPGDTRLVGTLVLYAEEH